MDFILFTFLPRVSVGVVVTYPKSPPSHHKKHQSFMPRHLQSTYKDPDQFEALFNTGIPGLESMVHKLVVRAFDCFQTPPLLPTSRIQFLVANCDLLF